MALCIIADVKVAGTEPARVDHDLVFNITLDVVAPLQEDLLFRCVFVGDASHPTREVELEAIDVGNGPGVAKGLMQFTFEACPPSRSAIEESGGPLDVSGIYLSALYRGNEFCRVGYYLRHDYDDKELQEDPPQAVVWEKLQRVLSTPCITKFLIKWDNAETQTGEASAFPSSSGIQ
eukprot:TRINITY_DN82525_c0_g1_i1.p1 TRINITY_DN82525_c0_g1~~TRINITY_DN82525_c0_g1_i1.p1  ORF type:complete len:192 (-),score=28.91 TRINITY_DN82525_c0_g1_i1:109-639(-)